MPLFYVDKKNQVVKNNKIKNAVVKTEQSEKQHCEKLDNELNARRNISL